MNWSLGDHLVQPLALLAIILISRVMVLRDQRRRARTEACRLRAALCISLRALRKLYENNGANVSRGRSRLTSGRNQITLLRTQMARLTSLESHEVEAVMHACVSVEEVETHMGLWCKKVESTGFWIPVDANAKAVLISALREAAALLGAAEEVLTPSDDLPDAIVKIERESQSGDVLNSRADPTAMSAQTGDLPDAPTGPHAT